MTRPGRWPPAVRERAVRLAPGHQRESPSQGAAITSIAAKCGVSGETLRQWVRHVEVDGDARARPVSGRSEDG